MPIKINLGCGYRPREGWINIDIDPAVNPNVVRNIEKGLPFSDSVADEVYASHVLEHVNDFFFVMQEIWRVCINGAIIKIIVPHWQYQAAFDPDHKRVIIPRTFNMYQPSFGGVQSMELLRGKARFDIVEIIEDIEGKIHSEPQTYFTLRVVKPE